MGNLIVGLKSARQSTALTRTYRQVIVVRDASTIRAVPTEATVSSATLNRFSVAITTPTTTQFNQNGAPPVNARYHFHYSPFPQSGSVLAFVIMELLT